MHKRGIGSISCAHFSNSEYSETASSLEIIQSEEFWGIICLTQATLSISLLFFTIKT